MHLTILNLHFTCIEVGNSGIGVQHKVLVISVGEIISCMGSSRLFSVDCRVDGLLCLHYITE